MPTSGDIFVVRHLGRGAEETERALQRTFSLVSLMHPTLTRKDWAAIVRHYRARACNRAGLMVIEDRRGYAHGLFSYTIDKTPSLQGLAGYLQAPVLCLRDLVLANVPGRGLERVLTSAAESRANELGCQSIRLEFIEGTLRPENAALFSALGYVGRGMQTMVRACNSGEPRLGEAALGYPAPEAHQLRH